MIPRSTPLLLTLALAACGSADPTAVATAAGTAERARPGAVFTLSDDPAGNAVIAFVRAPDGSLSPAGTYPTGGLGAGGGLGSQGALVLSRGGRFLFAVDAGSNEVASFRVAGGALTLAGRAPSGGVRPVSLAEHGGLLYVVNAGDGGSISGFTVGDDGSLEPLAGSTRPLATPGAAPGQIAFDPHGEVLVVTEKSSNVLAVYRVDPDGLASAPEAVPSPGPTPFGFAFTRRGVLVVSEAFGGQALASAVSSYVLDDGELRLVSPSVATGQTAACWVAVTGSGRFAYAANAGSDDLSSYAVNPDGSLTLLAGNAAPVVSRRPIDIAVAGGDRFLYALSAATRGIDVFAVAADGSLTPIGTVPGPLAPNAVGIAAR